MRTLALIVAALSLSACTTIHFDNGQVEASKEAKVESWHHNVVFGLIEVSKPVDPVAICEGSEWATIKTEQTFLNGFASGLVNTLTFPFPLWQPKTASVTCE